MTTNLWVEQVSYYLYSLVYSCVVAGFDKYYVCVHEAFAWPISRVHDYTL